MGPLSQDWMPSRQHLHSLVQIAIDAKEMWYDRREIIKKTTQWQVEVAQRMLKHAVLIEAQLLDYTRAITFIELKWILAWLGYAAFEQKPCMDDDELAHNRPFLWVRRRDAGLPGPSHCRQARICRLLRLTRLSHTVGGGQ
jgi:hypothetical protein